jgi:putative toxin-antitoxin system antitoxin component (TIGR02293 family)
MCTRDCANLRGLRLYQHFHYFSHENYGMKTQESERISRILELSIYVWNSEVDACAFLGTPHPMLNGRAPIDVSATEVGARSVEELLLKIYFGIPV